MLTDSCTCKQQGKSLRDKVKFVTAAVPQADLHINPMDRLATNNQV